MIAARLPALAALFAVAVACAARQATVVERVPATAAAPAPSSDGVQVIDDFESIAAWRAVPAEGVRLELAQDTGVVGRALRLDVDVSRGGYAIARRELDLPLPENYEITFWLRGELPPNTLEFKLVDASGENVWWYVERDIAWPGTWTRMRIRKRQVSFAWGPRGGGDLERVAALEIAVTAGAGGGSGSVWLDELAITPLEPVRPYDLTPIATASGSVEGTSPQAVIDGDSATAWRSVPAEHAWLTLDFQRAREYGGVSLHWDAARRPSSYDVQVSPDGEAWETVHQVTGGHGARDLIPLPETESRWLRIVLADQPPATLHEVEVMPLEWAASRSDFLAAVAAHAPRGDWPRYLAGEQAYWTIVGPPHGSDEALVGEDGAIEPRRAGPSLEPFLQVSDRLLGWNDVRTRHSLEQGTLPVPTVHWTADGLGLDVTAVADTGGAPELYLRYRVMNRGDSARTATLWLAVRPLQVNPSWQFLGTPGGAAQVTSLAIEGREVHVNGERFATLGERPDRAVALGFHGGSVTERIRAGSLPDARQVEDHLGYASGAVAFELELGAGASRDVYVSLPMSDEAATRASAPSVDRFNRKLAAAAWRWQMETGEVAIDLPGDGAELAQAVRSTLAYILLNRNESAIQPGTRSYRRSWIRDGSLTSAALLRLGREDAVREYIEWYAPFQYDNGKVPCCVDHRGADPVPEHDSHGQFIWLIAEYVRFTGDSALARRHWPRVLAAVAYMDSLRRSRMTEPYVRGDSTAYFGLLPQSISHEGYAEKPMHSFWDDLFGLRGYKDAAWLAGVVGEHDRQRRLVERRDDFRRHIVNAYLATMANHGIDYLAGAVELGDFDATSTTVAVSPVNEAHRMPQRALHATFDRYITNFRARRDGGEPWEAYTPYEWRAVGTLVRLDRSAEAHEVAQWFMGHRRPAAWNHWGEVVWRDPREPKFIGDMPHGWVGSDFIRSVLDMLAWEREADSALVVGAGIPMRWAAMDTGVTVSGLRTIWGSFDLRMQGTPATVTATVGGAMRVPAGGVIVRAPMGCEPSAVRVNEGDGALVNGAVVLRELPATVSFTCGSARRVQPVAPAPSQPPSP